MYVQDVLQVFTLLVQATLRAQAHGAGPTRLAVLQGRVGSVVRACCEQLAGPATKTKSAVFVLLKALVPLREVRLSPLTSFLAHSCAISCSLSCPCWSRLAWASTSPSCSHWCSAASQTVTRYAYASRGYGHSAVVLVVNVA